MSKYQVTCLVVFRALLFTEISLDDLKLIYHASVMQIANANCLPMPKRAVSVLRCVLLYTSIQHLSGPFVSR